MHKHEIPKHQIKRIEEIGLFLKNWRLNEGMSQREFSEIAEVHHNSIYHIENMGLYNIMTLLKCIDATGLTVSQFFDEMK